jgi:anti-sigma B factor antagonist
MEFESRLTIDEREIDGVTLLVLVGAITLDDGDLVFGKQIQALAAAGRIRIVADMQRVTYIDSAGLAMMAARLNMVRRQGGDIRLLHLNERGRRLLHVLKLPSTFEIFDDEELALRSFESRPSA